MGLLPDQDVTIIPMQLLRIVGQHPLHKTIFSNILVFSFTSSQIISAIMTMYKLYFNIGSDIEVIAPMLESLGSFYQMIYKNIFMVYNKKLLKNLLEEFELHWKLTEKDINIKKDIDFVIKASQICNVSYRTSSYILLFTFFLKPIVSRHRVLPFDGWVPYNGASPYYELAYFLNGYAVFGSINLVTGCDILFGALCAHIIVQFKLLNNRLEKLNFENDNGNNKLLREEFYACIKHHKYLLRLCTQMQNIYSFLMLNQFGMTIILICMELYSVLEGTANLKYQAYVFIYFGLLLLELGIYCIGSTYISLESSNTGVALYNSKWYQTKNKSLRQNVMLIMARSQKPIEFTAGGTFQMNMERYISVLKAGFSFYTYITHIKH